MDSGLIVTLALTWVAIVLGSWLGWQLLRQNGRILLRLDELEKRLNQIEFGESDEAAGLPIGQEAPAFELEDLAGKRRSLAQFRGQPLLLLLFNPDCRYCRELAPKLNSFLSEGADPRVPDSNAVLEVQGLVELGPPAERRPGAVIVTTGDAKANREWFTDHKVNCPVLLQEEAEVAAAYQANGTPSGYLVDAEGRIASELAMGADALLKLLNGKAEAETKPAAANGNGHHNGNGWESRFSNRSLARSKIKRDGLKAGTPAPEFRLPRLDGQGDLALADLRGRRVVLVFSSPTCGPCLTLAPHLQKFHREHPELELVMISKGESRENQAKVREFGLTFPIVLQQQWEISRQYAMFATPVAYLIDEQAIIAREVAVGSDAILDLMSKAGPEAARGHWKVDQVRQVVTADS